MATSYYRYNKPPSVPSNFQDQGGLADVTGTSLPTGSTVTYTPPTSATDAITINGWPFTATFSANATTTVTNLKNLILAFGPLQGVVSVSGSTTMVVTADAPGTVGDGIPVTSANSNGASWSSPRTKGSTRWFGQGAGASPGGAQTGGSLAAQGGGCGALQTGIGISTQTSPVAKRLSSCTSTGSAAANIWTPQTAGTTVVQIAGCYYTSTFNTSATQTCTDAKAFFNANPQVTALVTLSGTTTMVVTANYAGTAGNWIPVHTQGAGTGPDAFAVGHTNYLYGGTGVNATTDVASYQVGSGLDAQQTAQFAASRISPTYGYTVRTGESTADVTAGVVNAIGANDSVLLAGSIVYTPPTSAHDLLFLNGFACTVLAQAGTGTAGQVTYDTSVAQTVANIVAYLSGTVLGSVGVAPQWLQNLVTATDTGGTHTTVTIAASSTGVSGWSLDTHSAGLNSAGISAIYAGGGTTAKGLRVVTSTGTVANGGAVIAGWLNEFYPPGNPDQVFPNPNPKTGSIATSFVVPGRAA